MMGLRSCEGCLQFCAGQNCRIASLWGWVAGARCGERERPGREVMSRTSESSNNGNGTCEEVKMELLSFFTYCTCCSKPLAFDSPGGVEG